MTTKRVVRSLIGRRIVAVQLNRFDRNVEGQPVRYAGKDRWATAPEIVLDNGQRLRFLVQETEVGEYGVELIISTAPPSEPDISWIGETGRKVLPLALDGTRTLGEIAEQSGVSRENVRAHIRRWRKRGMQITPADGTANNGRKEHWQHGTTTGYMGHHCRCEECRAAMAAYRRGRALGL